MAILFMDGFDGGAFTEIWDTNGLAVAVSTSYGRLGGYGARSGDGAVSGGNSGVKPLYVNAGATKLSFGCAMNIRVCGSGDRVLTNPFGGDYLTWNNGDEIGLTDAGPSSYYSTTGNFNQDTWHWVEGEAFYSATVGTLKIWLNGDLVIDESGIDTGTVPTAYGLQIGGTTGSWANDMWYDDVVAWDDTGSYNTTSPIGDSRVHALFPSGDGNNIDFTGSDGNSVDNHLLVNEFSPDTTTYAGSATEGEYDLYALDNLPTTDGTILAIQVEKYAAKDDFGSKYGRSVIRTNSVDYPQTSDALSLTPAYSYKTEIIEENPNTTSAWTPTEVNALEAGFEVRDS
jgi:hypothetical protein